jgi:ferredoxin-NADP reductase
MAIDWQLATVASVRDETPTVRTFTLEVPGWTGHRPGQHLDLRLTAEDGYSVERSYSIASEPERAGEIDVTVERIEGGEVSPFLHEVVVPGDRLELRGPIGGYFVWDPDLGGPLQLIGGGSGVVPLMAMLRTRVVRGSSVPVRWLSSHRSYDEIIYREELDAYSRLDGVEIVITLTRSHPEGWPGPTRRVDRAMLEEHAWAAEDRPLCYVCGPTGFVETVADTLVELGHPAERVRTERFGPTGGRL